MRGQVNGPRRVSSRNDAALDRAAGRAWRSSAADLIGSITMMVALVLLESGPSVRSRDKPVMTNKRVGDIGVRTGTDRPHLVPTSA